MNISLEHPAQPDVVALIEELDAYQKPLYPPECHYGIDIAALAQPQVLFAVARDEVRRAVGCAAVVLGADYGEIKRMFVRPQHRGGGVARALLAYLEARAAAQACTLLMLETGIYQYEALAFYERAGFERCAAFGDYPQDPFSVFMRKRVAASQA